MNLLIQKIELLAVYMIPIRPTKYTGTEWVEYIDSKYSKWVRFY